MMPAIPVADVSGDAHAKVILVGEHFVVHGAPAIALPVQALTLRVELTRRDEGRDDARFSHQDAVLQLAIQESGAPLLANSIRAHVCSGFPLGAGLGGSAALAAATCRAVWSLTHEGEPAAAPWVMRVANLCEELAHGNPSGVDVATVLSSGPLCFVRGEPPRALRPGRGIGLLLIDSGTRGSTRDAVARVGALRDARPHEFADTVARARTLASRAEQYLGAGDALKLGAVLDETHECLTRLGVSTEKLDLCVRAARNAGALGAKLTGGGGGGVVIAVCHEPERMRLVERLRTEGHTVLASTHLGQEGPTS